MTNLIISISILFIAIISSFTIFTITLLIKRKKYKKNRVYAGVDFLDEPSDNKFEYIENLYTHLLDNSKLYDFSPSEEESNIKLKTDLHPNQLDTKKSIDVYLELIAQQSDKATESTNIKEIKQIYEFIK